MASVINPVVFGKYRQSNNDALPGTFDAWGEGAKEHSGTWRPTQEHGYGRNWMACLRRHYSAMDNETDGATRRGQIFPLARVGRPK